MLDEFTRDASSKTLYGEKGISNVLELEGEIEKTTKIIYKTYEIFKRIY